MMVSDTQKYLRGKFRRYSKDEILDSMFAVLDYIQIDRIAESCQNKRLIVETELEYDQAQKREREEQARKKRIQEYNALVTKFKTVGIEGMSLEDVKRMNELLKEIRKVTK